MQLVIFYLYLILHVCAARFEVIEILKSFWILDVTKQGLNQEIWVQ